MSRIGSFTIGFATGALTVLAFRRLREIEAGEDVASVSESIQEQLEKLESRIHQAASPKAARSSKKSSNA